MNDTLPQCLAELSACRKSLERIEARMVEHPDSWTCDEDKIRAIKRLVADRFRISITNLTGSSRRAEFSWPRHVAMFLMLSAHVPMARVARAFKHHRGSVMHGQRRVSNLMDTEPKTRALVEALRKEIEG